MMSGNCCGPMQRTQVKTTVSRRKRSTLISFIPWWWGSKVCPPVSKLEMLGVSRWSRGGHRTAWARGCGWICVWLWVEGIDTHVLHLTQLTLRICLRGTSPPRPIHQPGPNTHCAAVDTGLTTWHWQRWARPAAEWAPDRKRDGLHCDRHSIWIIANISI